MEETSLKLLRSHCCSCLSRDRKLYQLCRIVSGINNLYSLLSYDSEAYREGFYKDSASLFICFQEGFYKDSASLFICFQEGFYKDSASLLICFQEGFYKDSASLFICFQEGFYKDSASLFICFQEGFYKDSASLFICFQEGFYKDSASLFICFQEGFYKDSASLFICWECKALMHRFRLFRRQICIAQKSLSAIVERQDEKSSATLSKLSVHTNTSFNLIITSHQDNEDGKELSDNFIDCGPTNLDIVKSEPEDDLPLSELNNDCYSDNSDTCLKEMRFNLNSQTSHLDKKITSDSDKTIARRKKNKTTGKSKKSRCKDKKFFTSIELTEDEMRESRVQRKLAASFADSSYKCESCIVGFKLKIDHQKHMASVHSELAGHAPCDLCHAHLPAATFAEHRREHYQCHECRLCDHVACTTAEMLNHLKRGHSMKNVPVADTRMKGSRKTAPVKNPGSKPRRNTAMMDRRTPYGYRCTDCDKYFETKNQRWKHVQRAHRAGNTCGDCGRTFAFSNNLARHRLVHSGPQPREECPVCRKQIRVDLMKAHARIHAHRETHSCEECDKTFVSLASYEHHLKYSLAHNTQDLLKHKCPQCSKGYRSRGELRDHVNYQHKGTTLHKCPVCGKALASPRCITRHVRRVHEGIKESARDKICQLCGKAFRDKKGLREHERIHTGERPLSCSLCGATFRQSASLYTHKRRVHRVTPNTKTVEHTTES